MKTRIISAAVGIALMVVILLFIDTLVINFAIAILALLAMYELLVATKYAGNKLLSAASFCFVALVPFFRLPYFADIRKIACFAFIVVLFCILIAKHAEMRFEQVGMVFMLSVWVSFALSSIIFIRDDFGRDGLFLIILTLAGAWIADSGAYFVGRFFGKHKLAPNISPKKTIEGAVGGVCTNIIVFLLLGFGYTKLAASNGDIISMQYLTLALLGIASAVLGMLGDLTASIIKRQCSIKDFGHIMPGHGGVLDRFDSVLFVAPFMYMALGYLPLITR